MRQEEGCKGRSRKKEESERGGGGDGRRKREWHRKEEVEVEEGVGQQKRMGDDLFLCVCMR